MSQSTDLVLADKIRELEAAAAKLIIYSEQKYGDGSKRKSNRGYQEKMDKAFKLFGRLCEGLGQTEYGAEPYTGPETLEKYKLAVTESWSNKEEPKDSVKAITNAEVEQGNEEYESRKATLQARRILAIENDNKMRQLYLEANPDIKDTEEPSADELVEQALNGKRPKGRPAITSSHYTPLFANDGKPIARHVHADANRLGIDDYRGYQRNLLNEDDSPPPTRDEISNNYSKAVENRRRVMDDRTQRKGKSHITQEYEYDNDCNDGDEYLESIRDEMRSSRETDMTSSNMNEVDSGSRYMRNSRKK